MGTDVVTRVDVALNMTKKLGSTDGEHLCEMRSNDEFGRVDKWPVILDPGHPPIITERR